MARQGKAGKASAVAQLAALSRRFGGAAAADKLALLDAIASAGRLEPDAPGTLTDTLCFLRAYPDSAAVLERTAALAARLPTLLPDRAAARRRLRNQGIPGAVNVYPYSYGVARRLARLRPGALRIEWQAIQDDLPLQYALGLLLAPGEGYGLDDPRLDMSEWFATVRARPEQSDAEVFLQLLGSSSLPVEVQDYLFEVSALPLALDLDAPGSGRCEIVLPGVTPLFQDRPLDRRRLPLAETARTPIRLRRCREGEGREIVDLALAALAARNLEIHPLIYASDRDVTVADAGRGCAIALVGVVPAYRSPLEVLCLVLVLKNGVPIAYGPAAVLLGCCEMGINLFPEFRGAEVGYFYPQLLRVLHHGLGVEYFYLTAYGMGEDNEDAIESGAFWFYRKLGFHATEAAVEVLARGEERRMAADPEHRSSRAMLVRLSRTGAAFNLSAGRCRPLDLGRLGLAVSLMVARDHGGDRRRALAAAGRVVQRALGIAGDGTASWTPGERRSLGDLAPILARIDGLERWPAGDRRALVRAIRAKGGVREGPAARLLAVHARLGAALAEVAR